MLSRLPVRAILLTDAVVTGATGLLMLLGAAVLDGLLDLPTRLLAIAGGILVVYIMGLVAVARMERIGTAIVTEIAAINLAWGVGCVVLLAAGWTEPNALGIAFILVQVAAVVAFAVLLLNAVRGAKGGMVASIVM